MMDISRLADMELHALRDAREGFAAAAEDVGVLAALFSLSPEAIDSLIYAAAVGYNASMQRQSACGLIPL
jgi:hypothetical protein